MKRDIINFLKKIKVDTRFISILDDKIFISNLRFSRFSRKKEEVFLKSYPKMKVVRSKLFMKISNRTSHYLKDQFRPRDKIYLINDNSCRSRLLSAVLEPYTRKYGIQIFEGSEYDKIPMEIDSIAMSLNLDEEVINLVNKMFEGDEIILTSQNHETCVNKIIYPLINVPSAWISDWKSEQNPECEDTILEGRELDLINFLSTFIPDVKEKMYQSVKYLEVAKSKAKQ